MHRVDTSWNISFSALRFFPSSMDWWPPIKLVTLAVVASIVCCWWFTIPGMDMETMLEPIDTDAVCGVCFNHHQFCLNIFLLFRFCLSFALSLSLLFSSLLLVSYETQSQHTYHKPTNILFCFNFLDRHGSRQIE